MPLRCARTMQSLAGRRPDPAARSGPVHAHGDGPGMKPAFCLLGHSNRSLVDFLALLEASDVRGVADAHAFPPSNGGAA